MNIGDKIWYDDKRAIVTGYHAKSSKYTIAFYDDKECQWKYVQTQDIFDSRTHTIENGIYELLDKVWILESGVRSIGIVVGFEGKQYIVKQYDNYLWSSMNVDPVQLEHRFETYDDILFKNRKKLMEHLTWLKWSNEPDDNIDNNLL